MPEKCDARVRERNEDKEQQREGRTGGRLREKREEEKETVRRNKTEMKRSDPSRLRGRQTQSNI